MENSCFKNIRCLGGPESSKSAILDGKQLFVKSQLSRRSRELKIGYFRWKTAVCKKSGVQEVQRAQNRLFQMENSCFKKIRFLGGPESSKSTILDGKQLFVKNQLSRGSRELKIGCHRWKTAVLTKSAVQEVRRAQNRLFQIENSCFKKIRCLGGPESSKSAILDGKQLFVRNQVFRRSRELKIGYFRWKTAAYIKSGVQRARD